MNAIKLTPTQAQYLFHSVEERGTDKLIRVFSNADVFNRKSCLKIQPDAESIKFLLSETNSQIEYFSGFISEYQDEELDGYWKEELRSYRGTLKSMNNLKAKLIQYDNRI